MEVFVSSHLKTNTMENKKTNQANLEKRKGVFFQLGLVIALSLVLIAFEWSSAGLSTNEFDIGITNDIIEEIIPVTRPEQPEPVKPPLPIVADILSIVDDNVEIEDELVIEDTEIDIDSEIPELNVDVEEPEEDETKIFIVVEDMPSFQGKGQDGFRDWISKNLRYPEIAAENRISGKVYVRFVVEPDGSVNNVEIVRGVDPALDKEALRVVSSSPKWIPGKQRGKPVRVAYTFPISFVLK